MNQSNRGPGPAPSADQSALSLLVNAADSREGARQRTGGTGAAPDARLAETLRLRGLAGLGGAGGEPSLEEQLLLQQQGYGAGNGALFNQLRDQNLLSQISQQQQLASLLGLGGGGGSNPADMRQALAAAQLRQNQAAAPGLQGLTQADLITLSRSGALSGLLGGGGGGSGNLGGAFGAGAGALGGGYGSGLASELEGLQRLEELNRRQRLLAASAEGAAPRSGLDRAGLTAASNLGQGAAPVARDSPARAGIEHASRKNKTDAAASAAHDATKEELEKTPGSVIVPCRARGMPMDHNFKTAYFVIPENVKHGEELICSYFACRNAGIKFRYCSHCKVPVAKRNFRKRHKHGGEILAAKGDDSGGEEDVAKKGIPSQITANREEAVEADGISSQSADSVIQQEGKDQKLTIEDMQQGLVRDSMRDFEAKMRNKKPSDGPKDRKISAERKERWHNLLVMRPSTKESDSMSSWLMEVLAVSDLNSPLKAGDPMFDPPKNDKEKDKKRSKSSVAESPRSDNGYGSSNDDSGNEAKVEDEKEKQKSFNGGIIKKKRPADLLDDEVEEGEVEPGKTDSYVSGSFAEWKERKKQRLQSKSTTTTTMTNVSHQEQV